jgi:hypothetical protein
LAVTATVIVTGADELPVPEPEAELELELEHAASAIEPADAMASSAIVLLYLLRRISTVLFLLAKAPTGPSR